MDTKLIIAMIVGASVCGVGLVSFVLLKMWLDSTIKILNNIHRQMTRYDLLGCGSVRDELRKESGKLFPALVLFSWAGPFIVFFGATEFWPFGYALGALFVVLGYITAPHPWRFTVPPKKLVEMIRADNARERAEEAAEAARVLDSLATGSIKPGSTKESGTIAD